MLSSLSRAILSREYAIAEMLGQTAKAQACLELLHKTNSFITHPMPDRIVK